MPRYPFGNLIRKLTFLAILLTIAGQFYTVGRVPAYPTDDDGAYAAAGWQIWQTGRPGVPGYRTVVGMGSDVYALGHLGAAVQGALMAVFGIGVRTAILPSVIVGVMLLGWCHLLGRRLWGVGSGLVAALLLGLSGVFFGAAHSARPDLLVTLFLMIGFWLVAGVGRVPGRSDYWRLGVAGLVMGVSGDAHPNGFLLAPLPLVFWLMRMRPGWSVLWRGVAAYGSGGLVGIGYWIARHYLPNPEEFWRQSALHGMATHGVRLRDHGLTGALRIELQRYLNWFWNARGHRHLYEGLCVMGAGVLLVWRGDRTDRALVGTWGVLFLIAAALMGNEFGWYLIFSWPLFCLWIGRAVALMPWPRVGMGLVALLIAGYIVNHALWFWKASRDRSLTERVAEIRAEVPAGAPVLASAGLWFALWDRDFTHEPYLPFRVLESRLYPETGPTGWEIEQQRCGWQYVVAYGNLRRFLDSRVPIEEILAVEPWRSRQAEVREARDYARRHLTVVRRLDSPDDPITIFRVEPDAIPLSR